MRFRSSRAGLTGLLLVACCAGQAGAQSPPAPAAAASAAAPAADRSVFDGYRAYDEPRAIPWRDANDTVGRIGGWRAYAREAQGQPPAPAPTGAPPAPHGGHR